MKKMTRNEFLKMAGTSAALVVFNTVLMPAAVAVEPGVVALSSKKSSIIKYIRYTFPVQISHKIQVDSFLYCSEQFL